MTLEKLLKLKEKSKVDQVTELVVMYYEELENLNETCYNFKDRQRIAFKEVENYCRSYV